MKILLSHGYFLSDDPKEQEIMKPYPPLGILYISSYLKAHDLPVELMDSTFMQPGEWKRHLLHSRPQVLALYVNLMTKIRILELLCWLRMQESLNTTRIVLGGPDITHNIEDYLNAGADMLVIGEGEETMLEICTTLRDQGMISTSIAGTAFRTEQGILVKNPPREKIKDIDSLPFPDRQSIPFHLYLDAWKSKHGLNAVSVSTQRGCPYTCKWCSTAVYGQSYRRRSPANVVEELKELTHKYQPDTFWFVDDVFTVSHRWLNDFLAALKKEELKIRFECITRADRLNEEVILTLKEAGCFRIWIGAESGSQEIINAMDRRVDVMHVREMIRTASRHGIQSGTFIMLGYPGEKRKHIQETIVHLKEALPDIFTITVAYPIKGTRLFTEVENMQKGIFDWNSQTDRQRDFRRELPRRYYELAVRRVVNEVEFTRLLVQGKRWSNAGMKRLLRCKLADALMYLIEWFSVPYSLLSR
jgi:radical SAM superfamily enzyme YgiQ (UPF0313 family)